MTTPGRPANLSAEGAASLATVIQPLQPTVEVAQQVRRAENEAPPSTALEPVASQTETVPTGTSQKNSNEVTDSTGSSSGADSLEVFFLVLVRAVLVFFSAVWFSSLAFGFVYSSSFWRMFVCRPRVH